LTLFDEPRRVYIGLEQIEATAASLRECQGGQLSVLALPAFTHSILPGACRRFLDSHRDASISIASQESPVLDEWLAAQRYDLGLTKHDAAPTGTQLTPLREVDEVCVLPDNHPLLAKRVVELSDFADQRFIGLASDDPYRIQMDDAFARRGVVRRLVVETP